MKEATIVAEMLPILHAPVDNNDKSIQPLHSVDMEGRKKNLLETFGNTCDW